MNGQSNVSKTQSNPSFQWKASLFHPFPRFTSISPRIKGRRVGRRSEGEIPLISNPLPSAYSLAVSNLPETSQYPGVPRIPHLSVMLADGTVVLPRLCALSITRVLSSALTGERVRGMERAFSPLSPRYPFPSQLVVMPWAHFTLLLPLVFDCV